MKKIFKPSDLILNIKLEDMNNIPIRVSDCNYFKIRIFTTNENDYIEAKYEDGVYTKIVEQPTIDQIYIESSELDELESGVIGYSYEFGITDEHFSDDLYNETQKGCTQIYLV